MLSTTMKLFNVTVKNCNLIHLHFLLIRYIGEIVTIKFNRISYCCPKVFMLHSANIYFNYNLYYRYKASNSPKVVKINITQYNDKHWLFLLFEFV